MLDLATLRFCSARLFYKPLCNTKSCYFLIYKITITLIIIGHLQRMIQQRHAAVRIIKKALGCGTESKLNTTPLQ